MASRRVSPSTWTAPGVLDQPVGAEPDLVRRFLAAGVEHGAAGGLEPRRGLEQQRGLADAGLAADQHHRAGHDAAAEHEVELGNAGAPARRAARWPTSREPGRRARSTARAACPRRRPCPPPAPRDDDRLLRHRVPRAARLRTGPTHLACSWPHSVQR